MSKEFLGDEVEGYYRHTRKSRLDKSLNTLVGILEGIEIDAEINPQELAYLQGWINEHQLYMSDRDYSDLINLIREAILDGILTKEEIESIDWKIRQLKPGSIYYDAATAMIQHLQGIVSGIGADGKVKETELQGLQKWINDTECLKGHWPYDEIEAIVHSVMKDGIVDKEENEALLRVFSDFIPDGNKRVIKNQIMLKGLTVVGVCAINPDIIIQDKVFCFTGHSVKLKRREIAGILEGVGAFFTDAVTKDVDYLIVGADGNACWAYSCYGRKVERAVEMRKDGHHVMIIHEVDFWDALQ